MRRQHQDRPVPIGSEEPLLLEELLAENPEESKCNSSLAKALQSMAEQGYEEEERLIRMAHVKPGKQD